MIDDKGACWRCRFFVRDDDAQDEGGFCQRFPPTCACNDGELLVMWPGVEALDWCGEFSDELSENESFNVQTNLLEFQQTQPRE